MNKNKLAQTFACISMASVLVGCAGLPVNEAKEQLAIKPVCCKNFYDVKFKSLDPSKREKFEISSESPVMSFEGGRSFFEAYILPAGASVLKVQSINSSGYLPKATYVDPVVLILDQNKNILLRKAALDLKGDKHTIMPGLWEWYFGATISLPAGASYVIIHPDIRSVRRQRTLSENGTPWQIPAAPIGPIALVAE